MMNYIFLATILALIVWSVAADRKDFTKVQEADEANRLKFYKSWFIKSWIFGALGLIGLAATGTLKNLWSPDFINFGLSKVLAASSIDMPSFIGGYAMGALILLGFVAWSFHRAAQKKLSDKEIEHICAKILPGDTAAMIPRNKTERKWGTWLSIAAGINEELLFRGLLLSVLVGILGASNVILAAILAAILFGAAHAYQGITGVLATTLTGGFLMLAYLYTGNIFLPMLIHFLADFRSLTINSLIFEKAGLFLLSKKSAETR
jgi:membrane protease YdiL (CAAX protease family)